MSESLPLIRAVCRPGALDRAVREGAKEEAKEQEALRAAKIVEYREKAARGEELFVCDVPTKGKVSDDGGCTEPRVPACGERCAG